MHQCGNDKADAHSEEGANKCHQVRDVRQRKCSGTACGSQTCSNWTGFSSRSSSSRFLKFSCLALSVPSDACIQQSSYLPCLRQLTHLCEDQ
jgi:hypothetical protein